MLRKHAAKIGLVLISLATLCTSTMAARHNSADVLVVPSRYTVVQFAFDIVALRDVALVAYSDNPKSEEPLLHAWNADSGAWKRITVDEYAVGAFSSEEPDEMILVGSDSDLPDTVIAGASQAKNVTRIKTLGIVDLVNTLHKRMKFSEREWNLLAERHGLKIKDLNYERRRWGRYGPPKTKRKRPVDAAGELEQLEQLEQLEEELDEAPTPAPEPEESEPIADEPVQIGPVEEEDMPAVEPPEADVPEAPKAKVMVEPEAPEAPAVAVEPAPEDK